MCPPIYYKNQVVWFEFDNLDTLIWRNKPEIFGLPNLAASKSTQWFDWYINLYPGIKNIAFIPSKKISDCIGYEIVTANE
jgi:hypothetical protein